jgi:hypothetical protein
MSDKELDNYYALRIVRTSKLLAVLSTTGSSRTRDHMVIDEEMM